MSAELSLNRIEKETILMALGRSQWVQKRAAALLDITPRVLNYKIATHGITHPRWYRNRTREEQIP